MFCPNCGNQLVDGAKFCNGCGTPVASSQPAAAQPAAAAQPETQPTPAPPASPAPQPVSQPAPTPQPAPAAHAAAPQPAPAAQSVPTDQTFSYAQTAPAPNMGGAAAAYAPNFAGSATYTTAAPQNAATPAAVAEPDSIKAFIEKHSNGSNIFVYCVAFIAAAVMLYGFFMPWCNITTGGVSYAISPAAMMSGVGNGIWNANPHVVMLALYAVAEVACLLFIKNPKVRSIVCIAIVLLAFASTVNLYATVRETVDAINNNNAYNNNIAAIVKRTDLATKASVQNGLDIYFYGILGALATNIIMFIGSFRKKATAPAI